MKPAGDGGTAGRAPAGPPFPVRHRNREQLSRGDRRRRPRPARGRNGQVRSLPALERGFPTGEGAGIEYLRYGPPYYREHWARQLRLGFRRQDLRRTARGSASSPSPTSAISACPIGPAISRTRTGRPVRRSMPAPSPRRFPWVRLYTPVNEIFVTAAFPASTAGGMSA